MLMFATLVIIQQPSSGVPASKGKLYDAFIEPKFMFTLPFKMKITCNYSLTANFFGNLTLIFLPSYFIFLGVLISKHTCYYMANYIMYLFQLLLLIYFLMT